MLARSPARVLAAAQPQASSAIAALYSTGRDPSLGDQMKETVCELLLLLPPPAPLAACIAERGCMHKSAHQI
jgi:hypothetical protein